MTTTSYVCGSPLVALLTLSVLLTAYCYDHLIMIPCEVPPNHEPRRARLAAKARLMEQGDLLETRQKLAFARALFAERTYNKSGEFLPPDAASARVSQGPWPQEHPSGPSGQRPVFYYGLLFPMLATASPPPIQLCELLNRRVGGCSTSSCLGKHVGRCGETRRVLRPAQKLHHLQS